MAPTAAQKRAAYKARWGGPTWTKPAKPMNMSEKEWRRSEEAWRARFFRTKGKTPRCATCVVGQKSMPKGKNIPDGTENAELVPCGHLYVAAMYELVLIENKVYEGKKAGKKAGGDGTDAQCMGKHMEQHLAAFELIDKAHGNNGVWDWEKMVALLPTEYHDTEDEDDDD